MKTIAGDTTILRFIKISLSFRSLLFGRRRGRRLHNAFAFDDFDVLIDRRIRYLVHFAARPFDLDAVDLRRLTGAQNFARVVRRQIAAAAGLQPRTLHAARRPRYDRAYRAWIAFRRDELKSEPVVSVPALVAQQDRRVAVVDDQYVKVAVVIDVADRQTAGGEVAFEDLARLGADVLVFAVDVLEHQQRLFVFHLRRLYLDHVVGVAVGQDQVGVAVVVVIEELQSPAAQQSRRLGYFARLIDEGQVFLVVVKAEQLLVDVGDE